jgi:hypothetical protein
MSGNEADRSTRSGSLEYVVQDSLVSRSETAYEVRKMRGSHQRCLRAESERYSVEEREDDRNISLVSTEYTSIDSRYKGKLVE